MFLGSIFLTFILLLAACIALLLKQKAKHNNLMLSNNIIRAERDLLHARLEIQDHALSVIYDQIHDNIGQMLTGIQMKLVTLGFDAGSKRNTGNLSMLASDMGRSIKDLRNLSHATDSLMIEKEGLLDAIEKEIHFSSSIYHLECIFTCAHELPEMSDRKEVLLFRLIQEMMIYMFSRTKGREMIIRLEYIDDLFTASIAENNRRHAVSAQSADNNEALQHIKEKAMLLHGRLYITNQTGGDVMTFISNLKDEPTT